MESHAQLTTVSNEDSRKNGGKKQVRIASTSSLSPLKHEASLAPSPNSEGTPYGKTHAGEVRRRTDRQTGPLPAPGIGHLVSGGSANSSSRRPLQSNGSNSEGHDNDSDSDDDRKYRKRDDDGSDDVAIARREKRPAPSIVHYAEASNESSAIVDMDKEERFHRSMQQTLALVEKELAHYASPTEQRRQMAYFNGLASSRVKTGAIKSETYDLMLEYLEALNKKVIEEHTTALIRQQSNSSSENWKRSEVSNLVRHGTVTFKYVQLDVAPPCVVDLAGFEGVYRVYTPTVLRVLVKANTPRYAEIMSRVSLMELGWYFRRDTLKWCRNLARRDKFSGSMIYQMEMTGNITKVWEVTDGYIDLGFKRFLEEHPEILKNLRNREKTEGTEVRV
ncbi:hypothetical protein DPV78_012113 [Talaromyces pinophilus]|nr:hypothetical protein DPV78_012113 [Talaromyces pinophilus]